MEKILDENTKEFHPKVTIVIPVYNGSNYMRDAIDSALGQTYDNLEVIVVNDGSDDDGKTDKIAKSYGERIRYFTKLNGGVATALNLAIDNMLGEYFSWLSHDDMYLPDKIEQEVISLGKTNDPKTIICEGYQVINAKGEYITTINFLDKYPKEKSNNPLFLLMRGGINGCALLIHKSHFQRVGLFDPNLPTTQDYDMWFRMFRGQKICYLPVSNVLTRYHKNQGCNIHFESHVKECDKLWIRMMDELSPQEKAYFGGKEFTFYRDLWLHLETSSYAGATKHAQVEMVRAAIIEYLQYDETADLQYCFNMFDIFKDQDTKEYLLINTTEKDQKKLELYLKKYTGNVRRAYWWVKRSFIIIKRGMGLFCQGYFFEIIKRALIIWKYYGFSTLSQKIKWKITRGKL